ncbi:polysaccharide deacetylase family protein [Microbacterium sp.]|uniref:polysaccharide deacetylase family protein n=1 Tax=Microbacterium sp. TaxID=51671 RepID=UPI002811AC04|nr:polysaccharide deacetylase [Microbacterium sp.]
MPLALPDGTRFAVAITSDLDAQAVWMGTFGADSPSYLSRGEFGAEVGVPRVLDALARHAIPATWCVPSHSLLTFPAAADAILQAGHEIAAHGVYHEPIHKMERDEERRLMDVQLAAHERIVGHRPRGYRSPSWNFSAATADILEEYGFAWDSSLMARDFELYRPRRMASLSLEEGNVFGTPSAFVEVPVSWYLDDFPVLENLPRSVGMVDTEGVLRRWIDLFDFAYERVPNGVFTLTVHPQTIARGHHLLMFERFLEHVASHDGVWFATISDIVDRWTDD